MNFRPFFFRLHNLGLVGVFKCFQFSRHKCLCGHVVVRWILKRGVLRMSCSDGPPSGPAEDKGVVGGESSVGNTAGGSFTPQTVKYDRVRQCLLSSLEHIC